MKPTKYPFMKISDRYYKGADGRMLRKCEEPWNPSYDKWELRTADGAVQDVDKYVYDLADRNAIALRG
jgi:hypothetical protein